MCTPPNSSPSSMLYGKANSRYISGTKHDQRRVVGNADADILRNAGEIASRKTRVLDLRQVPVHEFGPIIGHHAAEMMHRRRFGGVPLMRNSSWSTICTAVLKGL